LKGSARPRGSIEQAAIAHEDLPLAIIIVDTAERTQSFLDEIAELVTGGLIIIDDVHVHRYGGGSQS